MAILVTPDSVVKLYKGIPFNNTYKYTTKFASESAQRAYFATKTQKTYNDCTYIRKEINGVRIEETADNVLDYNYIAFQNKAFGGKWFYGFVTDIEYVNNNTTYVRYELDVMQTWMFDYDVLPSFVEREHSLTDEIGINLVPENLEIGDYVYEDLGLTSLFSMYQIVVACTFNDDANLTDAVGGMYGGVYSGLKYHVFPSYTSANTFLTRVTTANKSDGIVSIFMLPIAFCADYQDTLPEQFIIERDKRYDGFGAYTPKNNKLYTAPYNLLYVTNNEGLTANYPFEYFDGSKCTFEISGAMCATPECMLTPLSYKGSAKNYNEKMVIGNFPQCAWNIDTFKAFVAQNSMRLGVGVASDIIKAVGGTALAGVTGGASLGVAGSGVTGLINTLGQVHDIDTQPPQSKGVQSSIINMANEIKGFQFYYARIRVEFARIIDDFFNAYGYATHRIKVPNINTRPHWNYVKTQECTIVGDVPADDLQKIRTAFDNGITFWRNPNNIGRYDLDNRP